MALSLRERLQRTFAAPFGGVLEVRAENAPRILIDGRMTPPAIYIDGEEPEVGGDADARPLLDEDRLPDCTWRCAIDVMERILSSNRALEIAYINSRLWISGDMSIMARLKLKGATS